VPSFNKECLGGFVGFQGVTRPSTPETLSSKYLSSEVPSRAAVGAHPAGPRAAPGLQGRDDDPPDAPPRKRLAPRDRPTGKSGRRGTHDLFAALMGGAVDRGGGGGEVHDGRLRVGDGKNLSKRISYISRFP